MLHDAKGSEHSFKERKYSDFTELPKSNDVSSELGEQILITTKRSIKAVFKAFSEIFMFFLMWF